jgi:hypothetical protein
MTWVDVTLNEVQCAYLRPLLFEELKAAAEALADKADAAAQCCVDDISGDDAHSCNRRVQATAELLDLVGWSVLTDVVLLREHERLRKQEGGT